MARSDPQKIGGPFIIANVVSRQPRKAIANVNNSKPPTIDGSSDRKSAQRVTVGRHESHQTPRFDSGLGGRRRWPAAPQR